MNFLLNWIILANNDIVFIKIKRFYNIICSRIMVAPSPTIWANHISTVSESWKREIINLINDSFLMADAYSNPITSTNFFKFKCKHSFFYPFRIQRRTQNSKFITRWGSTFSYLRANNLNSWMFSAFLERKIDFRVQNTRILDKDLKEFSLYFQYFV